MKNPNRIYGHNRRFLIQGPWKNFSLGAVDLEDAERYIEGLIEHEDDWRLWHFSGGKITICEMTLEEINKDRIADMFRT